MKPISAEDNGMEMRMGKRGTKIVGMLFVLVALLLFVSGVLWHANISIQDSDPFSYYVVVLLMVFPFLIFSLKEDLEFKPTIGGILLGVAFFCAFVAIFSYLSGALSFAFKTLGAFGVSMPFLLAALVAVPFGLDGVVKLKAPIIYSIFAGPIILMPVIAFNGQFVQANAKAVYFLLTSLGLPLQRNGITITAPSAFGISIASTCAAIGAFIALAMFLVPIAYLYEGGNIIKKSLWVVGGVLLMFVLNIIRMLSIALIWFYYGISNALTIYHIFIGQTLFYIAIIAMFIIGLKAGFRIERIKKPGKQAVRRFGLIPVAAICIILVFGVLSLLLTYGYSGYVAAPFYRFSGGSTSAIGNLTAYVSEISLLQGSKMNITGLTPVHNGYLFGLSNSTYRGANSIFVIANISGSPLAATLPSSYNSITPLGAEILQNGVTLSSYEVNSDGKAFHVEVFRAPVQINGAYYSANYEFFLPQRLFTRCGEVMETHEITSFVYNLFVSGGAPGSFTCAAYRAAIGA